MGKIKAEYEDESLPKTYALEQLVPVGSQNNMVYATIISLDVEGITEQVDFTID